MNSADIREHIYRNLSLATQTPGAKADLANSPEVRALFELLCKYYGIHPDPFDPEKLTRTNDSLR